MKIISGTLKGQNILVPNIPTIEPVKSEVRNAIFEILDDKVKDATCLDLFAGSGSLGLEALSRGAKHCTFVEGDRTATNTIQESLNNLNLLDQGEVIYDNVKHFVKKYLILNTQYSILFLDPPYVTPTTHLLKILTPLLQESGIMVYLCGRSNVVKVPLDLEIIEERCYGGTRVVFLGRR